MRTFGQRVVRSGGTFMRFRRTLVDMRSDTVTKPCDGMRNAMRSARVGDDVFGDDPTVTELEDAVAGILGKPRGLFVPSGTMSNLIAIAAHTRRGDEIILGDRSHIHLYEAGGVSVLMSVTQRTVPTRQDGTLDVSDISDAIRVDDPHYPISSVVALENTHNACGGRVLPQQYVDEVADFCRDRRLRLHLDGARVFNASEASGVSLDRMVRGFDSVSVCLSKGLGAPVGSVLVGEDAFVAKARRLRKMVGGGMRQAGVLCAAGLYALEHNVRRLADDHERAQRFASALSDMNEIDVDLSAVESNLIYFNVRKESGVDPIAFGDEMKRRGVLLVGGYARGQGFRAVTHRGIGDDELKIAIEAAGLSLLAARLPGADRQHAN